MKRNWVLPTWLCVCVLLMTAASTPALGQMRLTIGRVGQMEIGPSFLNLAGLNQALTDADYLPINDRMVGVGLGLTQFHRGWVVGGRTVNFMVSQSRFNGFIASLQYNYFTVYGGHVIAQKGQSFMLYPTVGIGAGLATLKATETQQPKPPSFNAAGFLFDAALTASFFWEMPDGKGKHLHFSITGGYIRALGNQLWEIDRFAPDVELPVQPEGPYVRVGFGMGALKRK
ncbi:MAG: hypothetical protein AAF206_23675 [Bacteroidota bacterium]